MSDDELLQLRQRITIELALRRYRRRSERGAVKELRVVGPPVMPPIVKVIGRDVAERHGLRPEALFSKTSIRPVVYARWEVWSALRERKFSYPLIGRWFSRDHSTVISGVRRHREMLAGLGEAA